MTDDRETELKFTLRPEDVAALRSLGSVDDLVVGDAETRLVETTYFDTPDRLLRDAGVSLRVRKVDGRFEQTLKSSIRPGASLASRTEVTVDIPGPDPDLAAFADIEAAGVVAGTIDGHLLSPVFTTSVTRTARTLVTRSGDEVELAVDDGEVVAGDRKAPLREAEFELKRGDLRTLFPLARRVMAGIPVRFAGRAKSSIGYDLADDRAPAEPLRADDIELARDASVEEALQAVLRSCLAQVTANVAAIESGDDPEGPHQLRIGLRRLRSALKVFAPVLDAAGAERIDEGAKTLGRSVGRLRDIDVLLGDIVTPCTGHIDAADLVVMLEQRRAEIRAAVLDDLSGDVVGAFLIDLAGFVEGRGWLSASDLGQSAALSAPAAPFSRKALHKRWRKTAKMGADVDRLSEDERHTLRKRFKTLRYALEFLGRFIGRRDLKALTRDVKAAQDVLGYLNDVRNARSLAGMVDEARGSKRWRRQTTELDRAVGFCLGWHEGEAARAWTKSRALVSLDRRAF